MIIYNKGAFGIKLLFRLHGSGLYRAMIPGIVSVFIYLAINQRWRDSQTIDDIDDLNHPYAVGVLVGSVSFLIVFRANFGYQRYWEACGATFHMMSKWMDATSHTGSYHMQCDHYIRIKPPSFFDYPELNEHGYTRDRERGFSRVESSSGHRLGSTRRHKSINFIESESVRNSIFVSDDTSGFGDSDATPLVGAPRLDGGWKGLFSDNTATFYSHKHEDRDTQGFASTKGGRTPSLFLQELAHLASLLNAVALSTLRNDVEGAESPLDVYEPGSPWPPVDPDKLKVEKKDWRLLSILKYMFSVDRTPEARTKYNSSRPLPVLGGVSDNEIKFLQMAKGPSAKTQLAWHWLSEFITREHLAGSTGAVGPPIISRVIQFLGDGMIHYNHARKIMFIPFPFPHAQLSVFYVLAVIPTVPFLMDQYTNEAWLGAILSFFTVTCLAGLHEVARELENPFRNVPNEIPLVTLQAMFNEALITMYSGYHPDAYWAPNKKERDVDRKESPTGKTNSVVSFDDTVDTDSGHSPERFERNESQKQQNNSVTNLDHMVDNNKGNTPDISELMKVVLQQSKEIERLRKIVEENANKG